ncbi:MAG TPA: hypothetical protein VE866_07695 [Candidatus Binatia bacterium]|nr:hypothetical protein [Candidatus Binatia bacterium]
MDSGKDHGTDGGVVMKGGLEGVTDSTKNAADRLKDEDGIFQRHGVQVVDMTLRGVKVVGVLGGVRRGKDQKPCGNEANQKKSEFE